MGRLVVLPDLPDCGVDTVSSIEQRVLSVAIGEIRGLIEPSDEERAAAYQLLIELATRLPYLRATSTDGRIRDALGCVDDLGDLTRSALRDNGVDTAGGSAGNLSLAVIAVRVLNEILSPVAARWRPLLDDHEARRGTQANAMSEVDWERMWPAAPECRSDLDAMVASVRAYIDTLSRIAGTPEVADAVLRLPSSRIVPQESLDRSRRPADGELSALEPREEMVRWLSVAELVRTARLHLAPTHPDPVPEGPVAPIAMPEVEAGRDFWFDYVADLGDGFDGTAPIAALVGRETLSISHDPTGEHPQPPAALPRPDLMVFGGDQIYPYATPEGYLRQTELPYVMGLAKADRHPAATLVTIPGNHDWLGGIQHFDAMFASGRTFAGRWKTPQRRRYWHVKLPHGWWLWGIDTGLHNEWPADQVAYFREASAALQSGDRVVLCTPVPLWQLRQKYPKAYVRLRSDLDRMIAAREATMPLCLSGDSHFFAHYRRIDDEHREEHITAGGGGAFLQPTHNLPERIPHETGNPEFELTARWPSPSESRRLAAGGAQVLDRHNWPLAGLLGLLHLAFWGLLSLDAWHPTGNFDVPLSDEQFDVSASGPWSWILVAVCVLGGALAMKPNSLESKLTSGARVYGALVGLAIAASLVVVALLRGLVQPDDAGAGWLVALAIATLVVGGLLSLAVVLVGWRWANGRVRAGDTMAFSPAHQTRYKHFLRCRIDTAGDLTVYVVGIDPVGRGWWEAMTKDLLVPPFDPAGIPRLHYVWGRRFDKFVPFPMRIAVSVSDAVGGGPAPGQAFLALGSRLIRGGHTLMYGGMPATFEGYTRELRDTEIDRHRENPYAERHLVNYVAEALHDLAATNGDAKDDVMDTIVVRRRAPGRADEPADIRLIRDLTAMRRRIDADSNVHIVIAGAVEPSRRGPRYAPGVLEEAYLALRSETPLLVIGGFGGVAGLIAESLLGRTKPAEIDELARGFVDPRTVFPDDPDAPDVRAMLDAFTSFGQLRNGLLDDENRQLLTTTDPATIDLLVWRSVRILGRRHRR